jgi:hypothetical protein
LTCEQLQRLAALSLEAISGVQFQTTDNDMTACRVQFVPHGDFSKAELVTGVIYTNGRWEDQT